MTNDQVGSHWCETHLDAVDESTVSYSGATVNLVTQAMAQREFYATAYRFQNGEGLNNDVDVDDIPENRRPKRGAILEAFDRHGPMCCWLVERDAFEPVLNGTE